VSQVLRLHNPHSDSVAFKVKTTAPKQYVPQNVPTRANCEEYLIRLLRYCVRPNSGRIDPSGSVEVQVLLQAMKDDPPADTRCRDKFLVQSVAIPASQTGENVAAIWSSIESTSKSSIQEKKIRVTFLPPGGADSGHSQSNNLSASQISHNDGLDTNPPVYSSPNSPVAVTPQRQPQGPVSTFDDKPANARSLGDAKNDVIPTTNSASHNNTNNTAFGNAAAAISSVIPTSQDDLQRQLDAAKVQISQLQQSATEGLRQRNIIGGGEKSASSSTGSGGLATTSAQPAGGVSVQVTAGLCLLCFLLAYFLF
jgi:hypothetical protein